ncbi:MAG: hypothetical protein EYC70_10995 [Planctomycetota bacterium]|nr:MAG: hypothetical protein EYC70_10995 [Planctomycetota bacterium]
MLIALLPQEEAPPVKDLVQVRVSGRPQAALLLQLASDPLDEVPIGPGGEVLLLADDVEQERLAAAGFVLAVLQEDLAGFYAARAAADPARGLGGSMGGFKTLAEIVAELDRLSSSYPTIVSPKFSIGTTVQGRPIYAVRVSDNPTLDEAGEPVAWFDAIHHAREPMSGEALLLFADWLCVQYGDDALATRLVNTRNVVIVPCVNPDGYEYNRQTDPNGGGLWRKNRRNNGGGSFGVDLNRNYGWEWGGQWNGSSGNPDSEVYRGPSAFSEPETRACRDALALHPPGMSISAHTYADLWLYSWGYVNGAYTPDNAVFRDYGQRMTAGNGYPFGTVWEILYEANGGSVDWHYGTHGTFAFTPEIGGDGDGFWPSPARIPALFEDVRPGFLMTAQWTGAWAERMAATYAQVSGDGDAFLEPGETWNLQLRYGNAGVLPAGLSLLLSSPTPDIVIESASSAVNVPAHAEATAPALRLRLENGAQIGTVYTLSLAETWDGETTLAPLPVVLGQPRVLGHDDMELADFGWSSSNATNWSWERAVPQATSSNGQTVQPGSDNPSGSGTRCWVTGAAAGSSAGTNDVDGITRLTSPRFRASGFEHLELSYARWFANQPGSALDDELVVEVSNDDGASWTRLEATGNANAWTSVSFHLEDFVSLSERMRLRFTAADDPNNDLTEAALDDLQLATVSALPVLGVWGRVAPGASVRLFLDGPPSASYSLRYSFQRGPGVPVSGIAGLSYLTGVVRVLLSGSTNGAGQLDTLAGVPNNPTLSGRTIHLQALLDEGGPDAAWSNLLSVVVE